VIVDFVQCVNMYGLYYKNRLLLMWKKVILMKFTNEGSSAIIMASIDLLFRIRRVSECLLFNDK
jgi:hypothetical protein